MKVPNSAAYIKTVSAQNRSGLADAYIANPICGIDLLTPGEALGAISTISAMLVADEKFRKALSERVTP